MKLRSLFVLLSVIGSICCAKAETTIKLGSISGAPGSTATLELQLVNDDSNFVPCAYQCDITLPEGVTINTDASTSLSTHVVASNTLSDGKYRILCYSMSNEAIPVGTVASFVVDLASNVASNAQFTVSNIEIADANSLAVNPEANNAGLSQEGAAGDLTNDGIVDTADLSALINIILGKADSVQNADLTNDGIVDTADLANLINKILGK